MWWFPCGCLSKFLSSQQKIGFQELQNNNFFERGKNEDTHDTKRTSIEKIYLCGGDSNLAGFVEYLSTGLGISVKIEIANVFVNVNSLNTYVPEINFSDSLSYATAIGLALRRQQ